MKRFLIHLMTATLAVVLLLTAASCTLGGGGIETIPQEETTAASVTNTPAAPADTSADTAPSEQDPDKAPDFTVLDSTGREVKLSDFFGKPIVLNFWASWCPPCKSELPDFEAAYKKYDGKVTFLMVNLTDNQRETTEVAQSFIRSAGYTFPVYFDVNYQAASAYGIRSIPQTYFINADGKPVAYATGMITAAQLEEGIGMIYSE